MQISLVKETQDALEKAMLMMSSSKDPREQTGWQAEVDRLKLQCDEMLLILKVCHLRMYTNKRKHLYVYYRGHTQVFFYEGVLNFDAGCDAAPTLKQVAQLGRDSH